MQIYIVHPDIIVDYVTRAIKRSLCERAVARGLFTNRAHNKTS